MHRLFSMLTIALAFTLLFFPGCTKLPTVRISHNAPPMQQIDPQQVQGACMSFAMRYTTSMADVYDRVQASLTDPAAKQAALESKLMAGWGSMGNAVNSNPIVGLMDMALMVTLTRQTTADPWVTDLFGADNQAAILALLQIHENNIWAIAAGYLSDSQVQELHELAVRWKQSHKDQRYVGAARLADFPESKSADAGNPLANSVFNLVRLDPFAGLDPAVRQIEESRVLAERMFFYMQNMPVLLSWQTTSVYDRMLSQPQITQFLADTTALTHNASQFTQATANFSNASGRVADSVEAFRRELPDQQATLVKQLSDALSGQRDAALNQATSDITTLRDTSVKQINDLIATQRDSALKQASDQIGLQRDQAIRQLDTAVTSQQNLLAKNVQGMMNDSIDRLYQRLWWLIFTLMALLLAVMLIYRSASYFLLGGNRKP